MTWLFIIFTALGIACAVVAWTDCNNELHFYKWYAYAGWLSVIGAWLR